MAIILLPLRERGEKGESGLVRRMGKPSRPLFPKFRADFSFS